MSVMVVGKFKANPTRLATAMRERAADFEAVSSYAKSHGALHHHFAAGDGEVVVIDEWENAEAFRAFFGSQPKIPELMREMGVEGEPDFQVYDLMKSPDAF